MSRGIYKQETLFEDVISGGLYSYTQVFFSKNLVFGVLLFLASMCNPAIGFCGLLSVLITQIAAIAFHLNRSFIKEGVYGFNSLFTGMAIGYLFKLSPETYLLLAFASLSTLVLTVWLHGIFQKYTLPFLSFPFVFAVWLIILSARQFNAIGISEAQIYWMNELYQWGGQELLDFYQKVNAIPLPLFITVFLKSLGAVFFQNNIISGFLIALGFLIYSRIAFTLSILGFTAAYLFYSFMGADVNDLTVNYNGSNYFFMAIALGGFFIVPSLYSYLLVIVFTPVLALAMLATTNIMQVYQLPVFSLPFSIITMLALYFLKSRFKQEKLILVQLQQYSPEIHLYKQKINSQRYKNLVYFPVKLPFWGEWMVSQGHDGTMTHLGDWSKAWDFILLDDQLKSYKDPGTSTNDFYCFNKPVLASAAGYVEAVSDHVDDNEIRGVNTEENWGNSIVIRHAWGLYSKVSHLKKESVKVKVGDYIKPGDLIATCGNSGRSPEPHLHFQVQALPYIGSKTLSYPICYYIERNDRQVHFKTYDIPKEGTFVSNVAITPLIADAFAFIPGQKLSFEYSQGLKLEQVNWEVFTDSYNSTYIYCHESESYAYFINDGTLFYFTDFYGNTNSLLYYFYLSCYKVLQGYYPEITIKDEMPLTTVRNNWMLWLQDFVAPFYQFVKSSYSSGYTYVDNEYYPGIIHLHSEIEVKLATTRISKLDFQIIIENKKIQEINIKKNGQNFIKAVCC